MDSSRKEIADAYEGRAGLRSTAYLPLKNLAEGNLPIQCLVQVEAVHADHTLAATERCQSVFGKAAVADE